ncbi:hypothetical protein HMI55_006484 [Coelomomyces lativittatus]|nr:hypothetical protein HMI55_006484 [Coelomomyces lativittatus]
MFGVLTLLFYKSYNNLCISMGLLFLIWLYQYLAHVQTEWVTVIRDVGCAFGSTSFLSITNEFYRLHEIEDLIVHETFQRFQCRFYLALIVQREKPIQLMFQKETLKLKSIQWILREINAFLNHSQEET